MEESDHPKSSTQHFPKRIRTRRRADYKPAAAQDAKQPYPTMAPVEQYLMDRDAESALARSAAPDAISHDASVIS
jgi:hypothetical protein